MNEKERIITDEPWSPTTASVITRVKLIILSFK
jgi:hypothetical protein